MPAAGSLGVMKLLGCWLNVSCHSEARQPTSKPLPAMPRRAMSHCPDPEMTAALHRQTLHLLPVFVFCPMWPDFQGEVFSARTHPAWVKPGDVFQAGRFCCLAQFRAEDTQNDSSHLGRNGVFPKYSPHSLGLKLQV